MGLRSIVWIRNWWWVAVDLPGRRDKAGDLIAASIDQWADSVMSDIEGREPR
jgi:surfactin synthase thioesterase subunit